MIHKTVAILKKTVKFGFKFAFIFYFIIANIYFIFANAPLYIQVKRTPAWSFFPMYHLYAPFDYNTYLSVITQGANGEWLMKDAYTTEKTNPTIFYFYYILNGKAAKLFNMPSYIAYHAGRIVSAEFFIIALYILAVTLLGKKLGFAATLISTIGTIAPIPLYNEPDALRSFYPWWGNYEALQRLNALPHYLFGFALTCLSVSFVIKFIRKHEQKYFILSLITVFTGGIIFPPSLLPVVIGIPVAFTYAALRKYLKLKKIEFKAGRVFSIVTIINAGVLALLIIFRENHNGFPWDIWNKWEIAKWNLGEPNFNKDLLLTFGILPILAIPTVIGSIISGNGEILFIAIWAYLPFILLPFANYLSFSKFRIVSYNPFIPYGMLVALTFFKSKISTKIPPVKYILIIIFVASTIPVTLYRGLTDIKSANEAILYTNIFLPRSVWDSIIFIQNNIRRDSVILSNEFAGNIIPANAKVTTYIGHFVHTQDYYPKLALMQKFYTNQMTDDEARLFLANGTINYVYYGPDEKMGGTGLKYPFLNPIFTNDATSIYEIK
jgi:hypothetical protein